MIFEKTVENNSYDTEDIQLEIEKELESDPTQGINVHMVGTISEDLIANFTLTWQDALRLHSGLTEYLKEVQQLIS